MAMGKKDIELLHEIALMAHRYTPNTRDMHDSKRRLASIAKAFAAAKAEVEYDSDEGEKLPLEQRQQYKDALEANPMAEITRFEIIDHRECVWCRGRLTANYLQKDGSYKELPCDKCDGSGISGGRKVIFWDKNAELTSSVQDNGRTLKLFIDDRKNKLVEESTTQPDSLLSVNKLIDILKSHRMK